MLHSYGAWICPQCGWTNSDLADYCPNPECIYGRGDEPSTANEVQGDQNIPKDAKVKRGEDDSFGREAKDRHQRQPRLERGNSTSQTKASTEHSLISDTTTEAIKTPITDSIISQHDGRRASAEHALDDSKELIEQPEIRPARDIILHPRKTSSKVLTSEDTEMEYQSQASFYGRDDKTKVIASIDHDTDVDTSELYVSKLRPIIVLDDDNESVISDTHSVSSIESQGSSSTRLSEQSPYDSRQIITATRELTLIFHQDETLIPLYQSAIENDKIGSERLQRNLRRLFKGYSKNLKNEAKDQLEYYSALFVGSKAKTLAESIIEKFGDLSVGNKKSDRETKEESSDEESRPVNDDVFADLVIFRNFLVRSEAFQTLHSQIHQFVLPEVVLEQERQSPEQISNEYHEQLTDGFGGFEADTQLVLEKNCDPQLGIRNSWGQQIKKHWESFAVATGHLEPTLEPGKQRLRWKCKCGMPFFGDVAELRPGGIADLKTNMERSSGVEFEKEGNSGSNTERRYRYQTLLLWLRDSLSRLGDGIRKRSNTPVLPRSNPSLVTSGQTALGNNVQPQTLHIMTCMQKGKYGKKLYQDLIKDVITDLQLFHFLKDRYVAHKGKFKGVLTLYSIKGIFFVKFRLPIGGSVEVRLHDNCCKAPLCECLPPKDKVEPAPEAEYRCRPILPTTFPPIMPEYLMHLFITPSCINSNDTWILDQIPKRICGELHGKVGQPAEGWGIYYQEGWNLSKIGAIMIIFFLFGSLIFGTMWAFLKKDVQSAFGVSAWIVSVGVALASLIVMGVDRP